MKELFSFFTKSLPLTIGIALTLTGLCFLVKFYHHGLHISNDEFGGFIFYFIIGFPTLLWGVQHLSKRTPDKLKNL